MFEQLILDALANGPKRTEELYTLAKQNLPADCGGPICPHRNTPSDMEWQHELRREQQTLKRKGLIHRHGNAWELGNSN
jgi:hypothetical protein